MRVAVVVDGRSEYGSLPALKGQLEQRSGNTIISHAIADIQPKAPIGLIASKSAGRVTQMASMGANRVVVVLDREDRAECPGVFAQAVRDKLVQLLPQCSAEIEVVVKDKMFENWLLSDPDAVSSLNGFTLSAAGRRAVEGNKADNADALAILKRAAARSYEKTADSKRILARASVERMASNSRSFRRYARCIGDRSYATQSARPARGRAS